MEALAEVYARSLHEVAEQQDKVAVIREQLGQFADELAGNRELQVFFFSPYFSSKEKTDGLARAVEGIDPVLGNFLNLLIEKHRMPAVMRMRRIFDRITEDHEGLLPVQITSAIPLDPAQAESLGARIGDQTGRKVRLNAVVEPEIIGGLILRVGNQILDASIRTRLERLRRQVATGA
ncbi:MAG: ATP synthase F1 subunit delta [Solirubrobacteraceae bacterium]|nr:ATP synthase F1 subunit delta [Solirubrobacteraceae bacterium]